MNTQSRHFRRVRTHTPIKRRLSATQIILLGFIVLIFIGTLLLTLPISSQSGTVTSVREASFTAVSATCVTGLVVVDTGTHWSLFGQIVIITLIQIGGLGFMTMAVMMSLFIKRQITPRERMLVAQSLGLTGFGGTVALVKRILIGTFTIEGIGAIILATRFVPMFGPARGIYYGIFHAISAFCNAGFDALGKELGEFSSFTALSDDPVITITLIFLIVLGGIGFVVWDDIVNLITKRQRISVYSKFVLLLTAILLFGGALLIAICEWNNPATLGGKSVGYKLLQCLFQSVTTRTAGIDMIGQTGLTEGSQFVSMLLMLVGGCSGSTAGGIKVGTIGVVLWAVIAFAKGENDVVVMRRKVSHETVVRALTVVGIDLAAAFISAFIILTTTDASLSAALYETCSAIATVGLSLSLTPALSLAGHIAVTLLMFFGRVGILTITYSILLSQAQKKSCITYPEINMMIG
ncbi:MAG: Trk family potassium uptake protein [Ruminococcaceae bacterium]|nr:Trk family potassium uptake protein [Oscillospiraceae bacterium]